jgi:hypothetical protein
MQHFLCGPCQQGEAKGLDRLLFLSPLAAYHGTQAGDACDCSGVTSFEVVVLEYTLAVILHIVQVDSDDTGTGYTEDSLTAALM